MENLSVVHQFCIYLLVFSFSIATIDLEISSRDTTTTRTRILVKVCLFMCVYVCVCVFFFFVCFLKLRINRNEFCLFFFRRKRRIVGFLCHLIFTWETSIRNLIQGTSFQPFGKKTKQKYIIPSPPPTITT